eukprot:6903342-Ditylum_brightwellii.AAC.1
MSSPATNTKQSCCAKGKFKAAAKHKFKAAAKRKFKATAKRKFTTSTCARPAHNPNTKRKCNFTRDKPTPMQTHAGPLAPVHDSHTTPHNPSCLPSSPLLPVRQPAKIHPNVINCNTIIWSSDNDGDYNDDDGRENWSGDACYDARASLPELKTDAGTGLIEFTALVDL